MKNESFHVDNEIYDLATLWVLRIILRAGGEKEFLKSKPDSITEFLGLQSDQINDQDIKTLKNKLIALEKTKISCKLDRKSVV